MHVDGEPPFRPCPPPVQRLLAIGALVLAMLLQYNVLRADTGVGQSLIGEEVSSLGADLLQSTFDEMAALPFDEVPDPASPDDLTRMADFGGASWDAAADLDDLDGATTTRRMRGASGEGTLDFELAAEVDYVRKAGDVWQPLPSGQRSFFKRVTLTASGPSGFAATIESVFAAEGL